MSTFESGSSGYFVRDIYCTRCYFDADFHPSRGHLCKFVTDGNVAWVGAASSIIILAAISIERYHALVYPFVTNGRFTKRKAKVSLIQRNLIIVESNGELICSIVI